MKPCVRSSIVTFLLLVVLAACGAPPVSVPTTPPEVISTQAAQTVIAQLTSQAPTATPVDLGAVATHAAETVIAQITLAAPTSTPIPTLTDTPVPTSTPLPTNTLPPGQPTATSTPQPSATLPAAASSGALLFHDDFEDNTLGWYEGDDDDMEFGYYNDAYRIWNDIVGAVIWTIHDKSYTDVRLEVDVQQLSGPGDGFYGVVCRYVDNKNYYTFVIGDGGFYGIGKMKDGQYTFLNQGKDTSGTLRSAAHYNRLRADCVGNTLTLYANGKGLVSVQDSDFASGKIGMTVGNKYVESGTEAQFDNFEIWRP